MGTISITPISDGTQVDADDVNSRINTITNEFNGSISATNLASNAVTNTKIADDAVTAAKIDFGGAGTGIWWEEIGRTTLTSAGDTITVSSIPARKYLYIVFTALDTGGTINGFITFNSDTAGNYVERFSSGGAADTTETAQTSALISASTGAYPLQSHIYVYNVATDEKVINWYGGGAGTAGTAGVPSRIEGVSKWVNTSAQIATVTVSNQGTGNFAIGSEVVVLGHD